MASANLERVGFGQRIRIFTGAPLFWMGRSEKSWKPSWVSDSGESSTTGISTRSLGCFSFLSLPEILGLLRGFWRERERQVLAWRMASSFVVGGVLEDCSPRERHWICDL